MSQADDVFYRQFSAVLILLVIFAFVAYFLANSVGGDALARIKQSPTAMEDRIAPVGSVETEEREAAPAAAAAAPAPAPAAAPAPAPAVAKAAPAPAPAPAPAAAQPAAAGSDDLELGRTTVRTGGCMACHNPAAPVANAPRIGNKDDWTPRAAQGLEALYNSGINGKGQLMPPKGANASLSDEAVKAAVRFMLHEAGVKAS